MAAGRRLRINSAPTAIAVRLLAFLVAAGGVFAIPAFILAASAGAMTHHAAIIASAAALALIVTAALVVRPFDPLRR